MKNFKITLASIWQILSTKCLLLLMVISISYEYSFAQISERRPIREYQTQSEKLKEEIADASIIGKRKAIDAYADSYKLEGKPAKKGTIPIVIHIMSKKEISIEMILRQIDSLSNDFSRPKEKHQFKHIADVKKKFDTLVVDMGLNFCLARAVSGDKTISPITYYPSYNFDWQKAQDLKQKIKGGVDPIQPENVLNVWVVDMGIDEAGFAQLPGGNSELDGVVINALYFGIDDNAENPYGGGKTLTHLVGGYLGLNELWNEKEPCADDGVKDTPIHNAPNYFNTKYKHISLCTGNPVELTMNYMDNTDDTELTMFTKGQSNRIQAMLSDDGPRASLLNNKVKCDNNLFENILSERNNSEMEITIYPNPSNEYFNVEISNVKDESSVDIQVFNSSGSLFWKYNSSLPMNIRNIYTVETKNYPPGIYNVIIRSKTKTVAEKIIVIK